MPAKNTIREFQEDGIYHVYNRGISKKEIFLDSEDYNIFLYYLSAYLLSPEKLLGKYPKTPARVYLKSLYQELELLSYCLMPNHFHLLIKTKAKNGISKLMQQLTNAYTHYFNNKYHNSGSIFQGRYKAVTIVTDEQLVQVARYIHLNPTTAFLVNHPKEYEWSSYTEYLKTPLICHLEILNAFSPTPKEFESFHTDQIDYSRNLKLIQKLTLES
jgi:putative transposase